MVETKTFNNNMVDLSGVLQLGIFNAVEITNFPSVAFLHHGTPYSAVEKLALDAVSRILIPD